MKQFIALVHKDPDSAYGVEFPDAPGCFSAADELADLQPNATEALSLYFEGEEVPEPRDLEEIRDKGTLDAIDQAAKSRGLNRSAFLAEAALNEIEGRH